MRTHTIIVATAATAIAVASVNVLAGGASGRPAAPPPFKVIFVSKMASKGEKQLYLSRFPKQAAAALRREIESDPRLSAKLRARGIQIRKIVGRQNAADGQTIFLVN